MKKHLLTLVMIFSTIKCFALNADSMVYAHQRNKINAMLDVRRQKFSEYTESLDKHTGIFGLQTKKDIKHSNDILMAIVETDDAIFKELKILLDYKTFETTQVVSQSQDTQGQVVGYMST